MYLGLAQARRKSAVKRTQETKRALKRIEGENRGSLKKRAPRL
jgi:hypothetical protein